MKMYTCFLIITFTVVTYASVYNPYGNDFAGGYPGRYGRNNGFPEGLHAPSRILKVQEISTVHGRPYGQPVLLKVFYRNRNNGHGNEHPRIIKVVHEDGHDHIGHHDPNFVNNLDGSHRVIKVIHEGQQQIHNNQDSKVVKVIHEAGHEHDPSNQQKSSEIIKVIHENPNNGLNEHGSGVYDELFPAKIAKILTTGNNVYENSLLGNNYAGGFTSGWAKV